MTETRHAQLQRIFLQAVALDGDARNRYLDESCKDDDRLRSEVERLLQHDAAPATGLADAAIDDAAAGFRRALASTPTMSTGARADTRRRGLPDQIGRYRILRLLGEGGMGVVYEAQQDNPRRRVALKIINAGVASSGMLRRFEHEAEVLGRLQHPGIAQIFEAGSVDEGHGGQPFFAMEYVDGQQITTYARTHNLSTRQRVELMTQVADAVQHAHQRGIIHRDLKPANILVDRDGTPKVLDFGVARATDADIQTATMRTDVGQLIGTLPYMSPEQAAGDSTELDTRSDVYALGVITFELLTGRLPYDLKNKMVHDAVRIIREEDPASLSTIDRTLGGDVDTIVAVALEKDRDRRYQSAEAFAEDIRRYLRDEPITARPPSTWYQFRKFAKRNRAVVGATAVIALVLIAATIVSALFALDARRERDRAVMAQEGEAEQRALAERRFEDVRRLANTFLFEVDAQIERLPGATPARETLVRTGLEYLDGLAAEASDDTRLLPELAEAYIRIGDIQGNPRKSNLGDLQAALASYEKSRELLETLAERTDQPTLVHNAMAVLHKKFAEVYDGLGRSGDALAAFEKSMEMHKVTAEQNPQDLMAQRRVAVAEGLVGAAYRDMGQSEPALEHFERELQIMRAIVTLDPESPIHRRDLGISLVEVGSAYEMKSEPERALPYYEESREVVETLAVEYPSDAKLMRDLTISYERIGNALSALERYDETIVQYEKVREIRQRLLDADPRNTRAVRDLSVSYEKMGDTYAKMGNLDRALVELEGCVALRRMLIEQDPRNPWWQIALGVGLQRVAGVQQDLGDHEASLATFTQYVEILAPLAEMDPNQLLAHSNLAVGYGRAGDIHAGRGGDAALETQVRREAWTTARTLYEQSRSYALHMREHDMAPRHRYHRPETLDERLAECDAALAALSGTR